MLTILIAAAIAAGQAAAPGIAAPGIAAPGIAAPAPSPAQVAAAPPAPPPTARLTYGPAPSQFVAVYAPEGPGPFPVAIFIHGGCYVSKYSGAEELARSFAKLTARGIAVWSIEYRRVDEPGGAFPGMYQDVDAAIDLLPRKAASLKLDPARVVVAGHSAGGHLALWAAGRGRVPASSPIHDAKPFKPLAVVGIAPPGDLEPMRAMGPDLCGPGVFEKVVGEPLAPGRTDAFADTSPVRLLPLGVPTVLVAGGKDDVVPAPFVQAYAAKARAAGDTVDYRFAPDADHIDVVRSQNPAWSLSVDAIAKALGK